MHSKFLHSYCNQNLQSILPTDGACIVSNPCYYLNLLLKVKKSQQKEKGKLMDITEILPNTALYISQQLAPKVWFELRIINIQKYLLLEYLQV